MIGLASLLSQIFLFAFALKYSFSFRAVTAESRVISPMLARSWPVITEKALFSFSKTIVNSMCTLYGDTMVGAMGVSNNLGGITTNPQNGFQEGAASIISQNLGARRYRIFCVEMLFFLFSMLYRKWDLYYMSINKGADYVFR
ncbi:MAG: hypothetical protein IKF00_05205 [Solobacterium sp.]|nr:hypothetical protein [Solobacterium sp.]